MASALGKIILLLGGLTLSACEVLPHEVPAPSGAQIKTVGVISAIGGELHYTDDGTFAGDSAVYPAQRYGIDRDVVSLVEKALDGRYIVKPVKYDPADFATDKLAFLDIEDKLGFSDPIGSVIRGKVTPNDLDAYVLVLPSRSAVKYSNKEVEGLGVFRGGWWIHYYYWVHALYGIAVVDGHTGKLLAWRWEGPQSPGFLYVPDFYGPNRIVDATYWPEDIDAVPPQQMQKLVDAAKQLISAWMATTLKDVLPSP